jgi:methyltransferase (TIGR00027 family)
MKRGHESQTAVIVAMARAAAHGVTPVRRFSDPTAITLLPADVRERIDRFRAGAAPVGFRERMAWGMLRYWAPMMVTRTVAIDDVIRTAGAPQLVILGAGLDGRAWRMPELARTVVWEVDHPDSQQRKRERIGTLTRTAREVRFVPVDFTRNSLDAALASDGHDPALPTTWVWEGVVMYLTPAEVRKTVDVLAKRSAAGSHLVILYHRPGSVLKLIGLLVRRMGEPLRSSQSPRAMRTLLRARGFRVVKDQSLPEIASELDDSLARAMRKLKHLAVVTAVRQGS